MMTFNEVFMAQNMARQRQTEIQRARHNDLLRAAREVHVAARRQRRALAKEARLQRRIERSELAFRASTSVEPRPTS
jgi:hypothetical protein